MDLATTLFPPIPPSAYRLRWTDFLRLRTFGTRPPECTQPAQQDPLERYSAALLLFEARGGLAVGSAVAVRFAGRLLLATAGHNLTGIRQPGQLRALMRSDGDLLVPVRVGAFGGRVERRDGQLIDVGWVELEPDPGAEDLLHFLDPQQLTEAPPVEDPPTDPPTARYLVHGVPAHLVQVQNRPLNRRLTLTPLSLLTEAVLPCATTASNSPDIALDYGPRSLPPAPGLSGGGIWKVDPRRHAEPRLAGITRGWWPRSRQLRGTPIHHWRKVIEEDLLACQAPHTSIQ